MILNLLIAVPAYHSDIKWPVHVMLSNLRVGCLVSESQAKAQEQPHDALLLPSAKPMGWHWITELSGDGCNVAASRNGFLATSIEWPRICVEESVAAIKKLPKKQRARVQAPVASSFPDIDWLLMVDADNWQYNPGPILQALTDAQSAGAAAVAAPIMTRSGHLNCFNESRKPYSRSDVRGKLMPVHRIGTGLMAVNVSWIREHWPWDHKDPWFQFDALTRLGRPHQLSEDYHFCDGLRARGGELLCDGRFEPAHWGVTDGR